jgi:hypothetical protein
MTIRTCEDCTKKGCKRKGDPEYTDLSGYPICIELERPPVASQPMIAKWLAQHQTRGVPSSLNGQGYRPSVM